MIEVFLQIQSFIVRKVSLAIINCYTYTDR